MIRGGKFKLCKNIYLIMTTIRYCSGSIPIQPFPAGFVPILPFPIWFWSDLYLLRGKNLPNMSRQRPDSPECDPTEIRQDLDAIWTQSARNGNEKFIQVMPVHRDSVPIHRTPSRHRPDNTGHCYDFHPIQQNLSRHSHDCHDCNPTRQNRLSFPNVTGRT